MSNLSIFKKDKL